MNFTYEKLPESNPGNFDSAFRLAWFGLRNTEHNGIKERQWQTIVALAWPFQPLEIRREDSCRHAKTRRLPLRPCSLTASEAAVISDAGSVEQRKKVHIIWGHS